MHTYFMREAMPTQEWNKKSGQCLQYLFVKTKELGGLLSGEHGVGFLKKEYLSTSLSVDEIALMKGIKQAFDPTGILNPGKVFPTGSDPDSPDLPRR